MSLLHVTTAELAKLRTLPLAVFATVGTILVGVTISAALAADPHLPMIATDAVLTAVPFMQAGFILLGIVPAGHEHAGGQYRTSLAAVPRRGLLVAGKSAAALLTLALAALLTVGAGYAAAAITLQLADAPATSAVSSVQQQVWSLVGAATYLVLIGLLSHVVALLVRHLVPALVTMLVVVLIVPPLLSGVDLARWLPSRAGGLLYLPDTDPDLTASNGGLVLVAWILAIGAAAYAAIRVRDA